MKTVVVMFCAALTLAASLCFAAEPVNLSSKQAKALMASKSKLVLLDVRTPDEYRQAHLHGAMLIPLSDLDKRMSEIPRQRPLLVYCAVGARSLAAARTLSARGFKEVYHISDGLVGWYRNGFPIDKAR